MKIVTIAASLLAFAASACVLPIRSEDLPAMMKALADSNASACMITGASGGGGALPISPVPVPGGGWGKADFTFCRSNEPGSKIEVNAEGVKIEHGLALADEIKEKISVLETAVKYLLQRLVDAQPKPGAAL